MDSKLMADFEELEGLSNQNRDEELLVDDNDDDDANFKPQAAATLASADIYFELDKRGLKTTGFPDTDREILQKAFDEEFKQDLENARARRREGKRRAARQAGLQRRRLHMEQMLEEEEDEMAKNHQVGMLVSLVKENQLHGSIKVDITSIGARALAKALWDNTSILCIDLSSNDLNDHSGSYLARILKRNNTISKLELDNNNLGPSTCAAFGEALRVNTALVHLSLDSNPLTRNGQDYSGFIQMTKALPANNTLKSLNLWRVGAGVDGGHALAEGIRSNRTLLFCDISHNNIDMLDMRRIAERLDVNMNAFSTHERNRRKHAAHEEERVKHEQGKKEEARKEEDLAAWLASRRKDRTDNRIAAELERQMKLQEDAVEAEKRIAATREAERKALEEADAKKKKKKK